MQAVDQVVLSRAELRRLLAVEAAAWEWLERSEPDCEAGLRGECNKGWHNDQGAAYNALKDLLSGLHSTDSSTANGG